MCGFADPRVYSVETAAKAYGYDELDAGAEPEDRDEELYIADKQKWYEDQVDNALYDGMPDRVFGMTLKAEPFLLRATRPSGEGIGLACRIISFW